jgi:hypothetical protein
MHAVTQGVAPVTEHATSKATTTKQEVLVLQLLTVLSSL